MRGVFDLGDGKKKHVCMLGEGVTIVCACLTEPLWQREREEPTHSLSLCMREKGCV